MTNIEKQRPLKHAVVLGGSMAGLLTARVLCDYFTTVTLVDSDRLQDLAEARKGVPQGRHAHNLLTRGLVEMNALFPGLEGELIAAGATPINPERVAWNHGGGWRATRHSESESLSLSRPLLETTILRRLRGIQNLSISKHTRAIGPLTATTGAITGVRTEACGAGGITGEIAADLVVDATGRGSATPRWLEAFGLPKPRSERLVAPVTYTSGIVERHAQAQPWTLLLLTGAPRTRCGFVFPIEEDRWLVSFGAMFDEPAPTDQVSFLSFAETLDTPDIHQLLLRSGPPTDIAQMRYPFSQRQHYERLDHFPEGLVVVGDAVCSFNPLLGQGMTVAAIEAIMLGVTIAREREAGGIRPGFAKRWFAAIKPTIDQAWTAVESEHYRYRRYAAERPRRLALLNWYLARLDRAMLHDPETTDAFLRVMSFMAPPASLFAPRLATRVLWPRAGS